MFDTILLQCTFYQFQYFITTCLCIVELYQEIFQSSSFNGNDNWSWSFFINKLSLIRCLNLFAPEAGISKWSKSIEQLHSSRWLDTADCLTLLRHFPVKIDIPICSAALVKKMALCFTIISNPAVTTRVSVNNARADLFLKGSLQSFMLFSIELTKRVLSCSDLFPIKERTQISSFLKLSVLRLFFIGTLSKHFLIQISTKLLG